MKNLLLLVALALSISAGAQNLCLQTMCNAVHCRQGDTVTLGALLTANNKVSAITFTSAKTNPNTPVIGPLVNGWATNIADTGRVQVTGLIPGTYVFNITGTDQAGGTVTGVDSIVVSAAITCPVIPPGGARIASWTRVTDANGVGRILVTYWDGTTALLP